MAGSLPNFHKMDSRSACIQGVLKVKVKVKGHVIRALSWILGMSYSVIDGLVSKSARALTHCLFAMNVQKNRVQRGLCFCSVNLLQEHLYLYCLLVYY